MTELVGSPPPIPASEAVDALQLMIRDGAHRADPHPAYHRLRANTPRLRYESGDWLFTRWEDCEAVLRESRFSSDPSHRVSAIPMEERSMREQAAASGELRTLLFLDPPDHTRIRKLVSKAFTPRTVERLRPRIAEIADTIFDHAAEAGRMDIVGDLGFELPVTVICELMGVPVEDRQQFGPWANNASRLLDGDILTAEQTNAGLLSMMEFINYFNGLFDERRVQPRDDLVSALLAAEEEGDRLSPEELISIVVLLFIAGHETTMNLIGNGMWALLDHPDELARLRSDPTLIGTAIEEFLRYDGPVHLTGRTATVDLDVNGITIPAGEGVITLLAAANRDPERFADPDGLDIGRQDNRHLTFSHGIHYCLGAALARLEGQIAIGRLVDRFPNLELAETPTYRDHFILRGLSSLQVHVG